MESAIEFEYRKYTWNISASIGYTRHGYSAANFIVVSPIMTDNVASLFNCTTNDGYLFNMFQKFAPDCQCL